MKNNGQLSKSAPSTLAGVLHLDAYILNVSKLRGDDQAGGDKNSDAAMNRGAVNVCLSGPHRSGAANATISSSRLARTLAGRVLENCLCRLRRGQSWWSCAT